MKARDTEKKRSASRPSRGGGDAGLELHRLGEQQKKLLEVSESILSTLSLDRLIRRILDALKEVLDHDLSILYWIDESEGVLKPTISRGTHPIGTELAQWNIPLSSGIAGSVARSGAAEMVNNASGDPRSVYPPGKRVRNEHLICVPLSAKGKTFGVFSIAREGGLPFTEAEFGVVKLFMVQAAVAIENARMFEQIRASEEKYRLLFEESKDVVFISTKDGGVVDVNQAGLELFGYSSKEEFLTVNIGSQLYANPSDREIVQRMLGIYGFVRDFELELVARDGRRLTVLETATAVKDEKGNVVGYRGMLRDITERKRLEEQLRQVQKLESLGTLAGGIAHDFNNILGIIGVHTELLRESEGNPGKEGPIVETIARATARGSNLVKQLLTFARKTDVFFEPVNVSTAVSEMTRMLGETFPKVITFDVQIDERLSPVVADHNQLHQALLNLCLNARDAMPRGGVIRIAAEPASGRRVREKFPGAEASHYVVISVGDTGVGMDDLTRSRIFEPFFTTKGRGAGTGLGLAVVYGVVQNHRGFIDLDSKPGHGTTFRLYLPMSPLSGTRPTSDEHPAEDVPGGTETILIAEDEEAMLGFLNTALTAKGYRVLAARDGLEALMFYKEKREEISLVVADMGLPKLDGYECFLKMKEINPDVSVLLASGYVEPGMKDEITRSGAVGFIQKPYSRREMLRRIRAALDAR